ncbi:MAG: DUF2961 domain-containing protein [Fimbriimonadaceae bacterium]|nr:DUF2961 domain-containing protein [Fimbriimonadaceae bacterium]
MTAVVLGLALAPVTSQSLVDEQMDLMALTRPPSPAFTTAQASSYDRASVAEGTDDWFANADAGHFVRSEQIRGRTEWVMAELKGPGALVRSWSANPTGVVRLYFDGEAEPRLTAPFADFLTGVALQQSGERAYVSARGYNNYWPFPYSKSLKITLENTDDPSKKPSTYYQFGYRTYPEGTPVISNLTKNANDANHTRLSRSTGLSKVESRGGLAVLGRKGSSGTISQFRLRVSPIDSMTPYDPFWLRRFILRIIVDGKTTVNVPLADFFASPLGGGEYETAIAGGTKDGFLVSRWPIPFSESYEFKLDGGPDRSFLSEIEVFTTSERSPWTLHAQWSKTRGNSRPFSDLEIVKLRGQGQYVGTVMQISNSDPAWWGEGDEKIWVDDEMFPSTFGTGTEDYFGYAWCDPNPFTHWYNAQTQAGTPGNFGHVMNARWHILDRIPFQQSLRFVMERWHWRDVPADYCTTGFWYAPAGTQEPHEVRYPDLAPLDVQPPAPEPGAMEGEGLPVLKLTGGNASHQGFWGLSSGEQLWWQQAKVGDELVLQVSIPEAGKYRVVANVCRARDYGKHHLWLGNIDLGVHDFFHSELNWEKQIWAEIALPKGSTTLRVVVEAPNPLAAPGNMFGLDYIKFERVD